LGRVQPNIFNNIIILKKIRKEKENFSNFSKGILKIFLDPSHVFSTILHNIRLSPKKIKLISSFQKTKKIYMFFYLRAYAQILKDFSCIFFFKKKDKIILSYF
jgi:hypothetical protein